ncbi:MAG: hypothetical protein MUE65_07075 [Methanomassiliicoccales archaeon]|nr:hypothetical protein [Methanomassiliicoccales archaeon]
MAQKRRLDSEAEALPMEEDDEDIPEKYRDRGWKHWLRHSYARYWYAILCVFLDVMVPLELYRSMTGSSQVVVPAFVLCALVALQVVIYMRLWPRSIDEGA